MAAWHHKAADTLWHPTPLPSSLPSPFSLSASLGCSQNWHRRQMLSLVSVTWEFSPLPTLLTTGAGTGHPALAAHTVYMCVFAYNIGMHEPQECWEDVQ